MKLSISRGKRSYAINLLLLCGGLLFGALVTMDLILIARSGNIGDEDAAAYALQGVSIRNGQGLISKTIWTHIIQYEQIEHAEDYWSPLQSFFVAGSIFAFGNSLFAIKLPNIIGFVALIFLIYYIASRFFTKRIGMIAAFMSVCTAELALYAVGCRSETFYFLFLLLAIFFLSISPSENGWNWKSIILAGLFSGLCMLQRSIALVLLPSALIFLLASSVINNGKVLPGKVRNILLPLLAFTIPFLAILTPYFARNLEIHGRPLPPLAFKVAGLSLDSFISNPDQRRNADGDLSHYSELNAVPGNKDFRLNLGAPGRLEEFIKKGLHETKIFAEEIKRGYIVSLVLLFLTVLAAFFVTGPAGSFLGICGLYLVGNVLLISFHQHTEQRYYIFLVPIVCIYSAFLFSVLEKAIADWWRDSWRSLKLLAYRVLIACFLCVTLGIPLTVFYAKQVKDVKKPAPNQLIGEWLKRKTSQDETIMCVSPYKMSFYSGRGAVLLPRGPVIDILGLCEHYGIDYVILPSDLETRVEWENQKNVHLRKMISIDSDVVFRIEYSPHEARESLTGA